MMLFNASLKERGKSVSVTVPKDFSPTISIKKLLSNLITKHNYLPALAPIVQDFLLTKISLETYDAS